MSFRSAINFQVLVNAGQVCGRCSLMLSDHPHRAVQRILTDDPDFSDLSIWQCQDKNPRSLGQSVVDSHPVLINSVAICFLVEHGSNYVQQGQASCFSVPRSRHKARQCRRRQWSGYVDGQLAGRVAERTGHFRFEKSSIFGQFGFGQKSMWYQTQLYKELYEK